MSCRVDPMAKDGRICGGQEVRNVVNGPACPCMGLVENQRTKDGRVNGNWVTYRLRLGFSEEVYMDLPFGTEYGAL